LLLEESGKKNASEKATSFSFIALSRSRGEQTFCFSTPVEATDVSDPTSMHNMSFFEQEEQSSPSLPAVNSQIDSASSSQSLPASQPSQPKSVVSPAMTCGHMLANNLSFRSIHKLSSYLAKGTEVESRTKYDRMELRLFPTLKTSVETFNQACEDIKWNSKEFSHCSVQFFPLVRQMVEMLLHQRVLDSAEVLVGGLKIRWNIDGVQLSSGQFVIVSTISLINLRRAVLSRTQHRLMVVSNSGKEDVSALREHLTRQIREEVENARTIEIPSLKAEIPFHIYYCLDLKGSTTACGLGTCKSDCVFCTLPPAKWANTKYFDRDFKAAGLMRDLKSLKHVFPQHTTIWDIMIDPLHMRIRLVINLLLQYVNAVKLLACKDLTERMWSLLSAIGVKNQLHPTKPVHIKMNGETANKTLTAFCNSSSLLDLLIDPSLKATVDFQVDRTGDVEAAYRESLQRKRRLFGELWMNLRTMLAFLQDSGVQCDVTTEEINCFQRVAKLWGLQWIEVAPDSMPTYVHVLVCHVHQYLREHRQLGLFSQQPAENKHKELKDNFKHLTNHGINSFVLLCQREWVNKPAFFFFLLFHRGSLSGQSQPASLCQSRTWQPVP